MRHIFTILIKSFIKLKFQSSKRDMIFFSFCAILFFTEIAQGSYLPTALQRDFGRIQMVPNNYKLIHLAALGQDKANDILRTRRQILLIQRIQLRLAELGIYKGLIDGEMTKQTIFAIKKYQKISKLSIDGKASSFLLNHLKSAVSDAQKLLQELDYARQKQIIKARKIIHNVLGNEDRTYAFDVVSNEQICLKRPTTRCLLLLAESAATQVNQTDLRDWTLSIVAAGFARVGDVTSALKVTKSIEDPRSIVVAISEVGMILAEENQTSKAVALANRFPEVRMRDKVHKTIAESAAKIGNFNSAITALKLIATPQIKFESLIKIADYAIKNNDTEMAQHLIDDAEKILPSISTTILKNSAFSDLALSWAKLGNSVQSNYFVEKISGNVNRITILCKLHITEISSLHSSSKNDLLDKAVKLTKGMENSPELDQAKACLAHAFSVTNDFQSAIKYISEIQRGFTHSYAISRVAISMGETLSAKQAVSLAKTIKDERLRIDTLLTIAHVRQDMGDNFGAEEVRKEVHNAAMGIQNSLHRLSVISDLSLAEAYAGRDSMKFFEVVLKQLKKMQDFRTRARVLTKAATTLYVLKAF